MREELASPVYAVLSKGLDVREQLERSPELLSFEKEQSLLKELVRKVPSLGEEKAGGQERFLGVRYPLVCWLDEIFIQNSSWKKRWTEESLEMSLHDSRDRAWKFWEQAQLAESRVSIDALEVFFLCAALGFRGEWGRELPKLQSWIKSTRSLLFDNSVRRWTGPDEVKPTTYVPPLSGAKQRQTMRMAWTVSLLFLIPLVVYFLVTLLNTARTS